MLNSKKSLSFLLILSGLMASTSLSTDVYLPAMPAMQSNLGGKSALTVTSFLIGFAIAQLIWGPISDRIGRKKPLFIGMGLFLVGSIGCAVSPTMGLVIFWRVVQAIGACVGPMLSQAMIRDLYVANKAAEMLSILTVILSIAPILAPSLGGLLLNVGSWRLIFIFMAIIAAVLLMSVLKLPETLKPENRHSFPISIVFKRYGQLLKQKTFALYTASLTLFYVGIYAFITGSSTVYISYFHVSSQAYGLFFGVNIIGVSLVSLLNRWLLNHYSLSTLMKASTTIAALSAIVLMIDGITGFMGIWGIVVPMFFVFSMNGIITACATSAALADVPDDMAGSAAALIGSLQYGSGILSSALLALSNGTPTVMASIIGVAVTLSALVAWFSKEQSNN
ncbi:Bcr/CflA family efflux MFS transporter [Loigolactobacillus bifermentans]|nr:Bcr/CflA family efflux MFS transporter [Loigolactobacillus bifermentans]